MYWPRNRFPVMTERTRLLSDLLYGLFSVILKMSTIKNRNFQHPRVRGHSTSYSLNGNEPGDTIETTRHSFFHEKFWNWARDQLKTTKWSANNFSKRRHLTSMSQTFESAIQSRDTCQQVAIFYSCQVYNNIVVPHQVLFKNSLYTP